MFQFSTPTRQSIWQTRGMQQESKAFCGDVSRLARINHKSKQDGMQKTKEETQRQHGRFDMEGTGEKRESEGFCNERQMEKGRQTVLRAT